MRKRLIICIIISAICLLNCCTFAVIAADEFSQNVEIVGDTMHVYGNLAKAEESEILIRVMKAVQTSDIDMNTIYIEQKKTDDSGFYEFNIKLEDAEIDPLPETLDGFTPAKYVYSIGTLNAADDFDSEEIEFYGYNYQQLALKLINEEKKAVADKTKTAEEAAENVKNVLNEAYERLYLGATVYDSYLINPLNITGVMKYVAELPAAATLPELKNQLNEAAAVTTLRDNKDNAKKIKEILAQSDYRQLLGLGTTTAYQTAKDFDKLCGDEMMLAYGASQFKTISESEKAFEYAVISLALKECVTSGQTKNLLETNAEILGIDVESYNLTEAELLELSGYEVKENLDEIKTKILRIINNRKSGGNPGGTGGSGSGRKAGTGNSTIGLTAPSQPSSNNEAEKIEFTDLAGYEWAKESIDLLCEKGIINGRNSTTYAPGENVTREEFLKMLIVALNIKTDYSELTTFSDVEKSSWYFPYVSTAYRRRIVNGVSSSAFGTGMPVRRDDAAVIAYRALENINLLNSSIEYDCSFTDADEISQYAYTAVAYMENNQILSGYEDSSFNASGTVTRAEAAVLIKKIIDFSNRIL